jgi:hypothetical protein
VLPREGSGRDGWFAAQAATTGQLAAWPLSRTCSRLDTARATDFSFCFGPATSRSGSAYLVAAWATKQN